MTTFLQTSFLGGEWSPRAQGNMGVEDYHKAMNVCFNGLPMEASYWTRRPGTYWAGTTRNGVPAVLRDFHFSQNNPYTAEFTPGFLRFFAGLGLATETQITVTAISGADPAEISLLAASTWSTGDQIVLHPTNLATVGNSILFNNVWEVTKVDTTHFTLADPITGLGLDGSLISGSATFTAARVLTFATNYGGLVDLEKIRLVQGSDAFGNVLALLFNPLLPPAELVTATGPTPTQSATFTFNQGLTFTDGPYLNFPGDGSTITPGSLTGTVTLTASAITSINSGLGFLPTDVGRLMRLFSEPPNWDMSHNYSIGDVVKFNNTYWQAESAGAGNQPGAAVAGAVTPQWFLDPAGAQWTWGTISVVHGSGSVDLVLAAADPAGVLAGGPLLYTIPINTWAMGAFSNTTGFPAGGTYHDGRFWLFGEAPQVFYGSYDNSPRGPLDFAPTDLYGNVLDASGCFEQAEADDTNTIFWMISLYEGAIIIGTESGEYLLQASNLGDPITPTSIQCHRQTKYRCANVEPRWTGKSIAFVQAFKRDLYEYVSDAYSRKLTAMNLSEKARHLTVPNIKEIAYQYALVPCVWARLGDGTLIGCTYKRESDFTSQPPKFFGWHRHALGSNRKILSIQSGPSPNGKTDSLVLCTQDTVTNICYVEFMGSIFDEQDLITDANFTDAGGAPVIAQYVVGPPDTIVLYGLNMLIGQTVMVWGGGLDLGNYTVSATGTITLTVGVANALFTPALLESLTTAGTSYGILGVTVQPGTGYSPNVGSILEVDQGDGNGSLLVPDWTTQLAYVCDPGFAAINVFDLLTGIQKAGYTNATNVSTTLAQDKTHLYWSEAGTNGSPVYKYGKNGIMAAIFGVASGSNTSNNSHIAAPYSFSTTFREGSNYLVSTSLTPTGAPGGTGAEVTVVNTDTMTWSGFAQSLPDVNSGRALLSNGNVNGIVYALAYNVHSGSGAGVKLYSIDPAAGVNPPFGSVTALGTITPAQIDGTWTSVDSISGLAIDETDGNLIGCVGTVTGSPTNANYAVKFSTAGFLIWAVPIGPFVSGLMQFSLAAGNRMTILGEGSGTYYEIDTFAGVQVASASLTGLTAGGYGIFNGLTGQIVDFTTYSGGGPVVIPPSAATWSGRWAEFFGSNGAGIGPPGNYFLPFAVGFDFTSQGQILRVIEPQQAGTPGGPALGKKRRNHQVSLLLDGTQGVSIGTTFTHLRPMELRFENNSPYPVNVLYSGVYWDNVSDTYSYDGMLCWQVNRGYPAQVCAIQGFQQAHDS